MFLIGLCEREPAGSRQAPKIQRLDGAKPGFKKFIYPHADSLPGGLKFAAFVSKFLLFYRCPN
jgi:hypothetical protein